MDKKETANESSAIQANRPTYSPEGNENGEAKPKRDFLSEFIAPKDPEENSLEPAPDFEDKSADFPELYERILDSLKSIFDPEIPVNIYDLGLIYKIEISEDKDVKVTMTLTTPHCPVAESMPAEIQEKVEMVEGVRASYIDLVWEPPWDTSMMSEAAQLELGFL